MIVDIYGDGSQPPPEEQVLHLGYFPGPGEESLEMRIQKARENLSAMVLIDMNWGP
jgi:hypothetical protein